MTRLTNPELAPTSDDCALGVTLLDYFAAHAPISRETVYRDLDAWNEETKNRVMPDWANDDLEIDSDELNVDTSDYLGKMAEARYRYAVAMLEARAVVLAANDFG